MKITHIYFAGIFIVILLIEVCALALPQATGNVAVDLNTTSYFEEDPLLQDSRRLSGIYCLSADLHLSAVRERIKSSRTFSYQMVGRSEASGGGPGFASQVVASGGLKKFEGTIAWNSGPSLDSEAWLNYWVEIIQRKPPPIGYWPPVPVIVRVRGEATASSDTPAGVALSTAFARIKYKSQTVLEEEVTGRPGEPESFDRAMTVFITPDNTYINIVIMADGRATLWESAAVDTQMDYQSVSDPVFEFDQAAFDQMAIDEGFDSFALDEYFGFEYSKGIADIPYGSDCPNLDMVNPVNLNDFSIFSDSWMLSEPNLPADLNHDNTVDGIDLIVFATYWLSDCYEE